MSWWVLPTTADIGVVAFAPSINRIMEEAAKGMQGILLSDSAAKKLDQHVRHTSQWQVEGSENEEVLLVHWLEEILYQCEVESRFLVDCQVMISDFNLEAQVSWVDAADAEREVEIKAVTRHQLICREVSAGELIQSSPEVPDFEGPGWMCQVIFDI